MLFQMLCRVFTMKISPSIPLLILILLILWRVLSEDLVSGLTDIQSVTSIQNGVISEIPAAPLYVMEWTRNCPCFLKNLASWYNDRYIYVKPLRMLINRLSAVYMLPFDALCFSFYKQGAMYAWFYYVCMHDVFKVSWLVSYFVVFISWFTVGSVI